MPKQFAAGQLFPADLKSAAAARASEKRHANAARCFGSAKAALKDFDRGTHIFGLTKGQFSMIDLAAAVLDRTGPARVSLWTWCVAEYEVEALGAFIADGRITDFRMVMDWAGAQRDMPIVVELQARYGLDCIRVLKTHAKVVTIATDDGWQVAIRGSMNLNQNPRFEQFDVSDDPKVFGVIEDLMTELWRDSPPLPIREMTHDQAAAGYGGAISVETTTGWATGLQGGWF